MNPTVGGQNKNFSIDGGATPLKLYNEPTASGPHSRDWVPGTDDSFNQFSLPGVANPVWSVDLYLMDAIGCDVAPVPHAAATPAGHPWTRREESSALGRADCSTLRLQAGLGEVAVRDVLPTRQELRVLRAIAREGTVAAAAASLFVSRNTVRGHLERLRNKTRLRHLPQLIAWAASNGWLSADGTDVSPVA